MAQRALELSAIGEECSELNYSSIITMERGFFEWTITPEMKQQTLPWGYRHKAFSTYVDLTEASGVRDVWTFL